MAAALSSVVMEEQMKTLYYKLLGNYVSGRGGMVLMRERWVDDMILKVTVAKNMEAVGIENLSQKSKVALSNYEVLHTSNNKKVLAKKSKDKKTLKAVVALEKSFDIVVKSHLETAHGTSYDMFRWLDHSKISVASICIPILREVCTKISKVCIPGTVNGILNVMPGKRSRRSRIRGVTKFYAAVSNSKIVEIPSANTVKSSLTKTNTTEKTSQCLATGTEDFASSITSTMPITSLQQPLNSSILPGNQSEQFTISSKQSATNIEAADMRQPTQLPTALVTIIDMSIQPDNAFKYLLVYKDWKTEFYQLRPLTNTDLIEEMTMELVKLFSDFAPPKCIMVQKNVEHIFDVVLARLNEVFETDLLLKTVDSDDEMYSTASTVEVKLAYWMMNNKSTSWSIGCNEVQWDINNTKSKDNNTPFENFFGLGKMVERMAVQGKRQNMTLNEKKKDSQVKNNTVPTDIVHEIDSLRVSENLNTVKAIENEILNTYVSKTGTTSDTLQTSQNNLNVENDIDSSVSHDVKIFRIESMKNVEEHIQNKIIETQNINHTNTNVDQKEEKDIFNNLYGKTVAIDSSQEFNIKIGSSQEFNVKIVKNMDTDSSPPYSCCTCQLVIATRVYFCYKCRKALHQYCGASKLTPIGTMESVCFLCL